MDETGSCLGGGDGLGLNGTEGGGGGRELIVDVSSSSSSSSVEGAGGAAFAHAEVLMVPVKAGYRPP